MREATEPVGRDTEGAPRSTSKGDRPRDQIPSKPPEDLDVMSHIFPIGPFFVANAREPSEMADVYYIVSGERRRLRRRDPPNDIRDDHHLISLRAPHRRHLGALRHPQFLSPAQCDCCFHSHLCLSTHVLDGTYSHPGLHRYCYASPLFFSDSLQADD